MLHRFERLEIDEHTRELRGDGRVATPQPRVFDVITYLARHRARVVPKDELLGKLWPDVLVTDASLQRAVSLARSICAELGASDVIRNYARQGYRFQLRAIDERPALEPGLHPKLNEARAHYAAAKWTLAIAALQAVNFEEGLATEDLQRWAHAVQCVGCTPELALPLERAVATYSARGDDIRAGWVAVLLSHISLEQRDSLAAKGWMHRAARMLEDKADSREYGYLSYLEARMGLGAGEFTSALVAARRAHGAGRRFKDPDLEYLGLLFAGQICVTMGRVDEGVADLDEAGVAVRSSQLSPQVGSLIYCGVISTAIGRADWERAGRWAKRFEGWCVAFGSHALPGLCRLHQAEILHVRGALAAALREVEGARTVLAVRSPWAEGEAWRVMGEIHLGSGDLAAAEAAFHRAHECGVGTLPGFALLDFERGNVEDALRLMVGALADLSVPTQQRRGMLLAHCCRIASHAGDLGQARSALRELDERPELWSTTMLRALVSSARAEFAAANLNSHEAIMLYRSSIQQYQAIDAPLLAARARCRLAELLMEARELRAAELERSAAIHVFKKVGAIGLLMRIGCSGSITGEELPRVA